MMKNGKVRVCVTKECVSCGKTFNSRTDRPNKFCSRKCFGVYSGALRVKERYVHVCEKCGAEYRNLNPSSKWCSRKCRLSDQLGERNPSWKSGRMEHKGYMYVRIPGEGYVLEQRYVMEKSLGRKLTGSEVVHHINENKLDNRLENLKLMSKTEHLSLHKKGRIVTPEQRAKISNTLKNRSLFQKTREYR